MLLQRETDESGGDTVFASQTGVKFTGLHHTEEQALQASRQYAWESL